MNIDHFILNQNSLPPVKAYVHNFGNEVYGKRDPVMTASKHLNETVSENLKFLEDNQFILAILWGSKGHKMIDCFGFDFDEWNENPDISLLVFREGIHLPERNIFCGDGAIILGKEEELRRGSKKLSHYLKTPLPELDLKSQYWGK